MSAHEIETAQASLGDVGVLQMVAAHIECVKGNMGAHYTDGMANMEAALYQDTQLFDVRRRY